MTFFSCFFGDFLVLPPLFYHKSGEKSVDIYFDLPFIYWLFGVSQSTLIQTNKEKKHENIYQDAGHAAGSALGCGSCCRLRNSG
jgi:hypothetical protein